MKFIGTRPDHAVGPAHVGRAKERQIFASLALPPSAARSPLTDLRP